MVTKVKKTDYAGHDHYWRSNVVAYVGICSTMGLLNFGGDGWNNVFTNNKCIFRYPKGYHSDCDLPDGWVVHDNQIFTKSGALSVCGTTLERWVAQGHDNGTTCEKWPSDEQIVQWGRDLLM